MQEIFFVCVVQNVQGLETEKKRDFDANEMNFFLGSLARLGRQAGSHQAVMAVSASLGGVVPCLKKVIRSWGLPIELYFTSPHYRALLRECIAYLRLPRPGDLAVSRRASQ